MPEIIDLNTLVKEPLMIKGTDGKTYKIPGGISTEVVLRLMAFQNAVKGLKKQEKIIDLMIDFVVDILNLDKEKNVDEEYVRKHFDDVNILSAIIDIIGRHIEKMTIDPNLPSPKSQEKE